MRLFGGGGSSGAGAREYGYAQITADAAIASAEVQQDVPGLSAAFTVPAGVRYVVEFYSYAIDEDSGTAANEQIEIYLLLDADEVARGLVHQIIGGIGNACYIRTATQLGDGLAHTAIVRARNGTDGSHGVIVSALDVSPAYVRVVAL